jgi:hypothetical protein
MAPDQIDEPMGIEITGKWPAPPPLAGHLGHEEWALDWRACAWTQPGRQQEGEIRQIQSILESIVHELDALPSR